MKLSKKTAEKKNKKKHDRRIPTREKNREFPRKIKTGKTAKKQEIQ